MVEGLDVRKYFGVPRREKYFSLDIPFYRTNYAMRRRLVIPIGGSAELSQMRRGKPRLYEESLVRSIAGRITAVTSK